MSMNRWMMLAYGVPWVYLALLGDVAHGTVLLYGVMAGVFFLLCWGSDLRGVLLGNLLSLAMSSLCLGAFGPPDAAGYFKPFTAWSLLVVISLAVSAVQGFCVWRRRKKAVSGLK